MMFAGKSLFRDIRYVYSVRGGTTYVRIPSVGNLKENVRSTTTKTPQSGVAFGVVEVVGASGIQVKGNFLFDDGSDTTLVTESFVRKLGVRGKKTTLNISGVGGKESKRTSSQVNLHVKTSQGNAECVNLTARSLPKICQPVGTVQ
ncbi:Pao retrotransposon peptidase superfamily [Paramuricea clavata]|uniref:Pao retrotransposon peptidase superfamily n=1 Tax=Paramuricea clavata TaxID=317549 RepID=A0A6S7GT10_PARCT|nr:Pao retrotransposon peptidase superfamily [Paramuricea clavata]